MARFPIHGMALLNAVRRREEVLDVEDPEHRELAQGEVWGIPLGAPGEARRHGQMGQRPRRPPAHAPRRQVIVPPLRRPRPGPYGPPIRPPPRVQVPDVALPAVRLRRESSMVELMNRRTVTPPAEDPDLEFFNLMNRRTVTPPAVDSDDDDAVTVKLEPEDTDAED